LWLGGFFAPQAFLTAVVQDYGRATNTPLENVRLELELPPTEEGAPSGLGCVGDSPSFSKDSTLELTDRLRNDYPGNEPPKVGGMDSSLSQADRTLTASVDHLALTGETPLSASTSRVDLRRRRISGGNLRLLDPLTAQVERNRERREPAGAIAGATVELPDAGGSVAHPALSMVVWLTGLYVQGAGWTQGRLVELTAKDQYDLLPPVPCRLRSLGPTVLRGMNPLGEREGYYNCPIWRTLHRGPHGSLMVEIALPCPPPLLPGLAPLPVAVTGSVGTEGWERKGTETTVREGVLSKGEPGNHWRRHWISRGVAVVLDPG